MTDTKQIYFGDWAENDWAGRQGYEAMRHDFCRNNVPEGGFPEPEQILFAAYECPSYEGYAQVLFVEDGKLFEVEASHCSCDGLGGQWVPCLVTWDALNLRYGIGAEAKARFNELVAENATPGVKA